MRLIRGKTKLCMKLMLVFLLFTTISYCIIVWNVNKTLNINEINEETLEKKFKQIQLREEKPTETLLTRDYHNYSQIGLELARTGPGEQGLAYHLPSVLAREKDLIFRSNGFNGRASDDISLERSLPDIRHAKCKSFKYLRKLPPVSVVVPFYNEHLSTLLRTASSVLLRSPPELLLEVLLVDDGSNKNFLQFELEDYIRKHFSKVKVLRIAKRAGLIAARLLGAKAAKGEVIIFLDSHTECNVNWLPPLLEPIKKNYRTAVCPFIDVIDYDTFEYRAQDEGARGAFDWQLYYKRLPITQTDKQNMPLPFKSPVMAGGLFAISSKFFWELGGYDPGLKIWGGEQYELSFKIWQCGGEMVDAPCSRVGHIYRKYSPFSASGITDYLGKNYKRVAEVWMDDYKKFLYNKKPHLRSLDVGDLSEQKALRERLQCKPFQWFMEEVAFDLMETYPPVEPPDYARGLIRSISSPTLCLDSRDQDSVTTSECGGQGQHFHLTWHKDIRTSSQMMCLDVSSITAKAPVSLFACHGLEGNQLWRYNLTTSQLIHGTNGKCLEVQGRNVFVSRCVEAMEQQKWSLENIDLERMKHWGQKMKIDFFDL